jgi:hypothetical protein
VACVVYEPDRVGRWHDPAKRAQRLELTAAVRLGDGFEWVHAQHVTARCLTGALQRECKLLLRRAAAEPRNAAHDGPGRLLREEARELPCDLRVGFGHVRRQAAARKAGSQQLGEQRLGIDARRGGHAHL